MTKSTLDLNAIFSRYFPQDPENSSGKTASALSDLENYLLTMEAERQHETPPSPESVMALGNVRAFLREVADNMPEKIAPEPEPMKTQPEPPESPATE